jgi:hypothetical protein
LGEEPRSCRRVGDDEPEGDTDAGGEEAEKQEDDLPASKCGGGVAAYVLGYPVGEVAAEHLRGAAGGEPNADAEGLLILGVPLRCEDDPCGHHNGFRGTEQEATC